MAVLWSWLWFSGPAFPAFYSVVVRSEVFRITGSEFKFWCHGTTWGKCPDHLRVSFPVRCASAVLPWGWGGIGGCGVSTGAGTQKHSGSAGSSGCARQLQLRDATVTSEPGLQWLLVAEAGFSLMCMPGGLAVVLSTCPPCSGTQGNYVMAPKASAPHPPTPPRNLSHCFKSF